MRLNTPPGFPVMWKVMLSSLSKFVIMRLNHCFPVMWKVMLSSLSKFVIMRLNHCFPSCGR